MVVCDIYIWFLIYCVKLWFLIYIYAPLFTWKSKKQKKIVVALPSAMTIALGKAGKIAATISQICRVQWPLHSAKKILKKIKTGFAECLGAMALGKEF